MTNENPMELDIKTTPTDVLDKLAHMFTPDTWNSLLSNRGTGDAINVLSPEFLIKYEDCINWDTFALFFAYCVDQGENTKYAFDLELAHRFWKFTDFDGGHSVALTSYKKGKQTPTCLETKILSEQCQTCILNLAAKKTAKTIKLASRADQLPTLLDYEKNPFFYDANQLNTIVAVIDDVPVSFAEKFVHLFNFNDYLFNKFITKKTKQKFAEAMGVPINNSSVFLFPDGTTADFSKEGSTFASSIECGNAFLDNVFRYQTTDETAIKEIVKKFPRAVKDCAFPENAYVMQKK